MSEPQIEMLCQWLMHVPLLHDLSPSVHAQIAAGMQIGVVSGGDDIIHVGEPGDAMYFLESGEADAIVRGVSVFNASTQAIILGSVKRQTIVLKDCL